MKLNGLSRKLRLWSSLCMHRREHKTLELRERANERANERASEQTARWFPFVVAYRCDCDLLSFSPEMIRRHGNDALAVARTSMFSSFPRRRGITKARKPYLAAVLQVPALQKACTIGEGDDGRRYSRWFSWRLRIYGSTLAATQYVRQAAPSPFSLAAYIILPIEQHTSFPLYVSIYNGPRNICSSLCAKEWNRTAQLDTRTYRVGWPDGANAGEPLATARGIDVLRPENNALWPTTCRIAVQSFRSPRLSRPRLTALRKHLHFPKIKDARMNVWQMWYVKI